LRAAEEQRDRLDATNDARRRIKRVTNREDGLDVPLALDETLREEDEIGSAHLDEISDGDDSEHQRELEPFDNVAEDQKDSEDQG
jgi:hypothetical protein